MSEKILDQLMPGEAIYPRNQWYVAGYSDELNDGPLERTLLDTPVVMYRTDKGEPAALFGALLLPTPGNYLMPFENFLDASHISFLHSGQLDQGNVAFAPFTTEVEGNWVKVHREIPREKQSSLTIKVFGFSGEYARREIIAESYVPSMCGIRVKLTPLNEALDAPAGETMTNQLAIGITPETTSSCHQFTAISQNFPFPEGKADNNKGLRDLLMQDVVAMENIQQTFDRIKPEERVEFSVKADEPAMRARRIIAKMIEDERDD